MAGKRNMPPAYKRKAAAYGQGFTVCIKNTVEGSHILVSGHFEFRGHASAILKIEVHELGANVENILYANNPVEIQKI